MPLGQLLQARHGTLTVGVTAHAYHPHHRHCHRQPQSLDAPRIAHLAVMPAQTSALDIFEARFNPDPQAIPRHIGLLRRQVGEDDPGMLIADLPLHQQRATQAALRLGKTLHHALPLRPRRRHKAADPVKSLFPNGTGLDRQIDAQERMPATGHNGRREPPGIQAAIRQHQDFPVGGHTAL